MVHLPESPESGDRKTASFHIKASQFLLLHPTTKTINMMFKALSALVLAASLLGATVASPMNSELEAGLQSRQSCGANNSACGSVLPACCTGLFCNTLNGVRIDIIYKAAKLMPFY
jgi:hypothetical protein